MVMGEMDDLYVLSAIFVVLLVLVAASIFVLLIFSGLFSSINVETSKPPIGEVCIAYKDGTGPYSGVGSNFSECTSIAPDLKVIGLYYDDPKTVPENQLRWSVGAILSENGKEPDETVKAAYAKQDYNFMTLPVIPASVNCVFPYVNMMSILIAVKRVYPALNHYMESRGLKAHPCIEVYFGGYIHFMMPLSSNEDFYSPETSVKVEKKTQEHGQDADQSKEAESKPTIPDVQSDPVADMTSPDDDSAADSDDSFEKVDGTELPK